jgi:hypothetical protein
MDDTSIQYRIRLAQINGIKLDEASSKKKLSGQGDEFWQNLERTKKNQEKRRASALGMYHRSMAKHLSQGASSEEAHERATADVAGEHGQYGLDDLDQHYTDMTGSKAPGWYSKENK